MQGGVQKVYRFANGYGASVVRHAFSYGGSDGLWELAVVKFRGPHFDQFDLDYDTPITDDVVGRITEDEVDALLDRIKRLGFEETEEDEKPDYAWPTVEDYEKETGYQVNDAFKMGWTMARTTNGFFQQIADNEPSTQE